MRILTLLTTCAAALGYGTACGAPPPDRPDGAAASTRHVHDCGAPPASALHATADSLVSLLIHALNEGDAALVAALAASADRPPDPAAAAIALDGFRQHLAGDIVGCAFIGSADGGNNHLEYRLLSTSGAAKSVVVYHDATSDRTYLYDEFLSYFPRAQWYAGAMVAALRAEDADRLARLLSVDDIDYPTDLARLAIRNYAALFDLATLEVRYEGLAHDRRTAGGADVVRPFHYTVRGTKADAPVEHPIVMTHGDGLLGWWDPLIPHYYGE
jgi:hypothetical protein